MGFSPEIEMNTTQKELETLKTTLLTNKYKIQTTSDKTSNSDY